MSAVMIVHVALVCVAPPDEEYTILGTRVQLAVPPEVPELQPNAWDKIDQPVAAQFVSFSQSRDAVCTLPKVELPASVTIGITASKLIKRSTPEREPSWNSTLKRLYGVTPVSPDGRRK